VTDGGAGFCDGCRLANGSCQPRGSTRQNNNICGSNGDPCAACLGATPVCDNGVCVSPLRRVGDACTADTQCQASLGPTAICKQQNLNGQVIYSGGYCSIPDCLSNNTDLCPLGSACLRFPLIFAEETNSCFVVGCSSFVPCRAGYLCFNIGNNTGACLPADLDNPTLVLDTTSVVGAQCTFNADCRAPVPGAPFAGGACLPEVTRRADGGVVLGGDGGPQYTGNPGGQCSRDCRGDADCSASGRTDLADRVCLGVSQTQSLCFNGCAAPTLGQSNCRTDYVCEQLLQTFADGGRTVLSTGYCESRCDAPGSTCGNYADGGPRACLASGYCR
jgi:hypothetical protein